MARTHYQLLGVSPHAGYEEIRHAYRRLAQRHHPDANRDDGTLMAEINAAWEVLRDPDLRAAYDRAIGTTPRPRPTAAFVEEPDADDLEHLRDDPASLRRSRPGDVLVAIPVFLVVLAVATFAFSVMVGSAGLRTFAILMAPVSAAGFVVAPLFMMMRSRRRDDD